MVIPSRIESFLRLDEPHHDIKAISIRLQIDILVVRTAPPPIVPSRSFRNRAQQPVIMSYPHDASGNGWIDRRQRHQLVSVCVCVSNKSAIEYVKHNAWGQNARVHPRIEIVLLKGRPTAPSAHKCSPQAFELGKDQGQDRLGVKLSPRRT